MATSVLSPIAVFHRVGSAAQRVLTTAATWIIHP